MSRIQVKETTAAPLLDGVIEQPVGNVPTMAKRPKSEQSKAVAIAAPVVPTSLLELCMMASRDKSMPAETVRAYLDMAKEQERAEAKILFDEAMLEAQKEMPEIPRDSYNKHTKAWWARIEGVSAKCDPIIQKHGFTLKYGMGEPRMDGHYFVFADVTWNGRLSGGKKASHTERYGLDIGRDDVGAKGGGTKTGAQGSISVLTYGRRNLKLSIFDVLVLGMDNDGSPTGGEPIDAEQIKDLRKKLKDANITDEQFCDVYKIDKIEHLPATKLANALDRIEQKQRATS